MRNDQYTNSQGETYVYREDLSRDGFYRPLAIVVNEDSGARRSSWRKPRSYRSYSSRRRQPRFWNYKGYVPYWFQDLCESVMDRVKVVLITAIISPILFAKLPALLSVLFQP